MSMLLGYLYSTGLTKEEQIKTNEKTKNSREEFTKGFVKGASFSLAAYSLYSMSTSVAYAADSNVPAPAPKTPGDTGAVSPVPTPSGVGAFRPLSDGTKGAFVGGASAICGAALQSGDFYLGLACAGLLIVGGIVINRP